MSKRLIGTIGMMAALAGPYLGQLDSLDVGRPVKRQMKEVTGNWHKQPRNVLKARRRRKKEPVTEDVRRKDEPLNNLP